LKLHYSCAFFFFFFFFCQFQPLLRVDKAHGFAITSLTFSHSGKYLASAGADSSCRIMLMPDIKKNQGLLSIKIEKMTRQK
jgi:WD40 repeat protein